MSEASRKVCCDSLKRLPWWCIYPLLTIPLIIFGFLLIPSFSRLIHHPSYNEAVHAAYKMLCHRYTDARLRTGKYTQSHNIQATCLDPPRWRLLQIAAGLALLME